MTVLAFLVAVAAQAAVVDAAHRGVAGAGQPRTYRTVAAALAAAPRRSPTPHVILIRKGRYYEKLSVEKANIEFRGEHRDSTILTYDAAAGQRDAQGREWTTPGSATLRIAAPGFRLSNMTVENGFDYMANYRKPAGDPSKLVGSQGVAVHLDAGSDRAQFRDCNLVGHQDTLFPNAGRSFFWRCTISGSVDFIFGAGTALFYDSDIISRDRGSRTNNGYIAAPSTNIANPYGLIFLNSRLRKDSSMAANTVTLGRAWHPQGDPSAAGTAVYLHTWMDDHIGAKGWETMFSTNPAGVRTEHKPEEHRFFEYGSRGPGAVASESRRQLSDAAARAYRIERIFDGWVPLAIRQTDTLLAASRIALLPASERAAWQQYIARSQQLRRRDRDSLAAERRGLTGEPKMPPVHSGFFVTDSMTPEWYKSAHAKMLADYIVSYQTPAGGWSKRMAFTRVREKGESFVSEGNSGWVGTIDNGGTTEQLTFLLGAINAHNDAQHRQSFLRGLEYLLTAQMPSGCWPQVFPLVGSYHDAATFNDEAMPHVLEILQQVPSLTFVPAAQKARAASAVRRGIDCILKAQVVVNGQKTGWGAQHDPITFEPVKARAYEHASLSGREGASVVNFLMTIPNPSREIITAVESAIAWFKRSAIYGYHYQPGGQLTPREGAGPIWARFYEIETNRPIFSDRDGIIKYSLAEMGDSERVRSYGWYTDEPQTTLRRYERWKRPSTSVRGRQHPPTAVNIRSFY